MKLRIRIVCTLLIILLAVCPGALAEGEKTEGDECYFLTKGHIVFSRNAYTDDSGECSYISIEKGENSEEAVRIDISFLSGEEAMKDVYRWDPSLPECVNVTAPPEGTTGEATFHIRVETEHYYMEDDITAKAMIFDQNVDTSPMMIHADVGKQIELARQILQRAPHIPNLSAYTYWTAAPDSSNPESSDEAGDFTALQEGEYRLMGILGVGEAGVKLEIPIVVYTGKSVSAETTRWLEEQGHGAGTVIEASGTTEGTTAAAADGDDGPDAGQPVDAEERKALAGLWTTTAFLKNGKEISGKDQVDLTLFLKPDGTGYQLLKSGGAEAGLLLTLKATDRGIEAVPKSRSGKAGAETIIRNDDGSINVEIDEFTFTLVQQEWPAELTEKKGSKPEDLNGKWVLCAVETEPLGIAPMAVFAESAKNSEHTIYIRDGVLDYFIRTKKNTQILMFNLLDEDGKLYAKTLLTEAAPISVTVYDNNWLEMTVSQQRSFFAREDFWDFSVSVKDSLRTVPAGKSLTFTAEFEQPERVKESGGTGISWSVTRQDGGDIADVASIDKKGVLKISKNLKERVGLEVRGLSAGYTAATYRIDAVPALNRLAADPEKAAIYLGGTEPLTVKVTADPADAMPENLEWKVSGKAVELETAGNDSARITAVQAGKATVRIRDTASGKSVNLTVTVLEPVTAVQITGPETVRAGKTAAYKAELTPKKPSDKTVIWSVDVGEDIATVRKNGQVKVSKNAPAGTVITLTAKAEGSPTEVQDSIRITVE